MYATAVRLLAAAFLLAAIAGYVAGPILTAIFLVSAGALGLLAWAAYLLHRRFTGETRPPLTRWQDGGTP